MQHQGRAHAKHASLGKLCARFETSAAHIGEIDIQVVGRQFGKPSRTKLNKMTANANVTSAKKFHFIGTMGVCGSRQAPHNC